MFNILSLFNFLYNMSIYFDTAATSKMPNEVKVSLLNWCNKGNPSTNYESAQQSKNMINELKNEILKLCNVTDDDFVVIFNSGASESNCTIIQMLHTAYYEKICKKISNAIPHIIVSSIEHKSILESVSSLERRNLAHVTRISPTNGFIRPIDVENAITPLTCLICIMHANNETGAINDIEGIINVVGKRAPFYCDTTQTFGKFPINTALPDAFCISFHKLHGPPGVGALIMRKSLIVGYNVESIIYGSQNNGLRGGTENVVGLGASLTALKFNFSNIEEKNKKLVNMKKYILINLAKLCQVKKIPTCFYSDYISLNKNSQEIPIKLVFISNILNYLPNIILMSVVSTKYKICNIELKNKLQKNGIIVSIGSACNTSSPNASHILDEIKADEYIKRGTLRISFDDFNTIEECNQFIMIFSRLLYEYI